MRVARSPSAVDGGPYQPCLHDARGHPDGRQRKPHRLAVPAVAIAGVEHGDGRQHDVGEVVEEGDAGEAQQLAVPGEQPQRADRVCAGPAERHAPLGRQGFGQDEIAVGRVCKGQACRHPERQPRVQVAHDAAERRSQHEADAEGRTDQPERAGAVLRRRHVRDVGVGRGEACRRDARDDAAEEQPRQRGRDRHQDVVEAEPQHGEQQHGTASVPVRQRAQDRREEELHEAPGGAEDAVDLGGPRRVAAHHALDQLRQHRNDDAERHHVEHHHHEDEGEGGLARFRAWASLFACSPIFGKTRRQ